MRPRFFILILSLLLPLVVGCSKHAARAGAGAQGPPVEGRAPSSGAKVVTLDEGSFSPVTLTNGIQPEWLVRPTNFPAWSWDWIEVENLGQRESRGILLVGPDGKVYYSLLPGLPVWGLTLSEVKELLESEMNRYNRVRPSLAVTLRAVGSKRAWILGAVQSPGVYPLGAPLTVLEAITLAGGITYTPGSASLMPDLKNSFLMRNGQMLHLDFHRLISLGDLSQNIYLQPDDFLYLRSSTNRNIYVFGAVGAPSILPYSDGLSILSALSLVGGPAPYANVTHVAVVRGSLTSPRIAVIDWKAISRGKGVDVQVEPGDIIYVPFVPYRKLAMLAEEMLGTLARTTAANEGLRAVIPNAAPVGSSVPVGQVPGPGIP